MVDESTVQFPDKRSLGSLYIADEAFPHIRKWIGEAKGKLVLAFPKGKMLGVALGSFGWEALADANCAELRCLRSIDLSTAQFCEKTVQAISQLQDLIELRLDFLKFADGDLSCLKIFPQLKTIWLNGTSVTDQGLIALCELPSLTNVVLKNTSVTDNGIGQLKALNLESVTLPEQISNSTIKVISNVSSLKRLDLSRTNITSDGLEPLAHLEGLQELYLNDTPINDASIVHLARLPSLKILYLTGTKVSDAAVPYFENMRSLEHLELRDTGVTEIGVARIRASLTSCAVFGG